MLSVSLLFRQVTRVSFLHSFSATSRSYRQSMIPLDDEDEDKDDAIEVPVRRTSKLSKQNSEKMTRKDRTSISVNKKAIDLGKLSEPVSHWTVEHVANAGIKWSPSMNFPTAHPAESFGDVIPMAQIMKDNTTPSGLKEFLKPIINKQGPSDSINRDFDVFMNSLVNVCKSPDDESHAKNMLIRLCDALYFNDPANGLTANIETIISASFPGAKVTAKPKVVIDKRMRAAPLSRTQLRLICSEAKPLLRDSRERGEVAGELVAAMLFNYILGGESTVPLVSIYTCGYYLRFVACSTPESYVDGLVQGTMHKITDRPVFTTYPAYNPNKPPEQQGFNLLDATERAEAISTLVQLRHNLITSKTRRSTNCALLVCES